MDKLNGIPLGQLFLFCDNYIFISAGVVICEKRTVNILLMKQVIAVFGILLLLFARL
jgi:hypothetical protein